jgi:hypothetical protein
MCNWEIQSQPHNHVLAIPARFSAFLCNFVHIIVSMGAARVRHLSVAQFTSVQQYTLITSFTHVIHSMHAPGLHLAWIRCRYRHENNAETDLKELGLVVSFCEHGKKLSGSIKCWRISGIAGQERLSSMELLFCFSLQWLSLSDLF